MGTIGWLASLPYYEVVRKDMFGVLGCTIWLYCKRINNCHLSRVWYQNCIAQSNRFAYGSVHRFLHLWQRALFFTLERLNSYISSLTSRAYKTSRDATRLGTVARRIIPNTSPIALSTQPTEGSGVQKRVTHTETLYIDCTWWNRLRRHSTICKTLLAYGIAKRDQSGTDKCNQCSAYQGVACETIAILSIVIINRSLQT